MHVTGYSYPWDVVADGFIERVQDTRVDDVAVALSYHSARAATPWSRGTSAVHARTAALYRPERGDGWGAARPAPAAWLTEPDPGAKAVDVLHRAGLPALGWLVLTHNSLVGRTWPDLAVTNCLGERYPWALCPAHPDVQHYAATLAAQAVAGLDLAGVVLEACGQLGVVHQCEHEKTDGAWAPAVGRLLSICCCRHCAARWATPADEVVARLRAETLRLRHDPDATAPDAALDGLLDDVLAGRHFGTDALRACVLAALDGPGRPDRVELHASLDPWATGALPGLTPSAAADVDTVVLPAWTPGPATEGEVRAARTRLPGEVAIGAYVTAVAAQPRPELPDDVRGLAAAGAGELHLYHLGLAGPQRWPQLRAAAHAARGIPPSIEEDQ